MIFAVQNGGKIVQKSLQKRYGSEHGNLFKIELPPARELDFLGPEVSKFEQKSFEKARGRTPKNRARFGRDVL